LQKCYKLLSRFGNSGGNYTCRPSRIYLRKPLEEDDWKAVFGKTERPFDEGVLEIGYGWASEALPDERGRNR
jgi:hypothetical protein